MKCSLIVAVFVLVTSVGAQVEHAPTVEQCRADQRLWLQNLTQTQSNLPSFNVVGGWITEMNDCAAVDHENEFLYYRVLTDSAAEQHLRMLHFLQRHNLYDKFQREDAEGKR